jgi:2,3-bisphosphoglycerate-dependent phosphoglycerate mutase
MSDLQCPSTVIVARHAEAEYEDELIRDRGGALSMAGREAARALAESLAPRQVSMVYSSDYSRAVQTAEIAACVLGVSVRLREGLREFSVGEVAGQPYRSGPSGTLAPVWEYWEAGDLGVGFPGTETGQDVVDRVSGVLRDIADLHRGETVLVISHGGAMCLTLPRLAVNVPDTFASPASQMGFCEAVELAVDSDGWIIRSWPGRDSELLG